MRKRIKQTGKKAISVNAIAGTHVVLLAFDANENACKGLLGFAIHRTDHTENEQYWLKGFKTFEETNPNPAPGALVSTYDAPVQAFMWGDYTAKPNHSYTYKVVPVYGKPKNLTYGQEVEVDIQTENEDETEHAVYFNRGVAGSQAYAREFGNKSPEEVGPKAYKWLSRGLEEAILAFIGKAKGVSYSIRAAAYEFSHEGVLKAFGEAAKSKADVKIVYDCRNADTKKTSDAAIKKAGIAKLMIPRTKNPSFISHNKFIILLKNGKPVEVLTGSTNFTDGGIYGQSNVVHIVRNTEIAQKYLDYWQQLADDAPAKDLRTWNEENTPIPESVLSDKITAIFSPRSSLEALEWYSNQLDKAVEYSGFTAAFGVNTLFADIMAKNKKNIRYILLEKTGTTYDRFKDVRNNFISIGAVLNTDIVGDSKLHRWVEERLSGLNTFVKYLHTKYLLVDPLSDKPVVICGSANFSDASTKNNDENMLIINGETRVADIYLGEFMRLWNHFYFRDIANRYATINASKSKAAHAKKNNFKSPYLIPDDTWTNDYFGKNFRKTKERELFM